jgi:hypothetical protein
MTICGLSFACIRQASALVSSCLGGREGLHAWPFMLVSTNKFRYPCLVGVIPPIQFPGKGNARQAGGTKGWGFLRLHSRQLGSRQPEAVLRHPTRVSRYVCWHSDRVRHHQLLGKRGGARWCCSRRRRGLQTSIAPVVKRSSERLFTSATLRFERNLTLARMSKSSALVGREAFGSVGGS